MTDLPSLFDRRAVLAGFGVALVGPLAPAVAQTRPALALEAIAGTVTIKSAAATPIWQLAGGPDAGPLRFKRGETADVTLTNRLPVPVTLNWIGLDGHPAAEPQTGRLPLAPNASATYPVTFRHAGTMLVDLIGIGSEPLPSIPRAIVVTETEPLAIDRDEVLMIQEWRLKPDGSAVAPGIDPGTAATIFTVNGKPTIDITSSANRRLRLRLINAGQRTVIAVKIVDHDVRVLAISGQPSEPFMARDGMIVLTPNARVDVVVDALKPPGSASLITLLDGREARPIGKLITSEAKPARSDPLPPLAVLPSNGLPLQLDLKSALRIDLPVGTADWPAVTAMTQIFPPALKVKRGRVVVLALANRGSKPIAFHLHGHHFRLLDRLDDGWKPFWLDTLAIDAGQTQRIAFAAEFAGLYPVETVATDWSAPRQMRSYLVE